MIKVLMLVPSLRVGSGVASFAISYFRKLNHNLVQLDFACYYKNSKSYAEEIENAGSKVFYLPSVYNLFNHFKSCRKIINENKYDIIHDCALVNTIPMMHVAKKNIKARILHSHSSKLGETTFKSLRNSIFIPFLRSYFTNFAACSELAAKTLFGNRPFTLISNVIDSNAYDFNYTDRMKIRNTMNIDNKLIIGTVGRTSSPKNPFRALSIFKEVHNICQNAEYWWIGDGSLLDELNNYAKKIGIGEKVRFWGNRKDTYELYQAMDVFFMPSKFEGLGIACVEAQTSGLPCVVSDAIPHTAAFTDLVTFIPLSEDNTYWANQIIDSASKIKNRRSYNKELTKSCFSDENAGERLREYYEGLLNK